MRTGKVMTRYGGMWNARCTNKKKPTAILIEVGFFHSTSFSLSLFHNLSAISIPSLTGSVVFPISLVANTSAESLMKSMSVIIVPCDSLISMMMPQDLLV